LLVEMSDLLLLQ